MPCPRKIYVYNFLPYNCHIILYFLEIEWSIRLNWLDSRKGRDASTRNDKGDNDPSWHEVSARGNRSKKKKKWWKRKKRMPTMSRFICASLANLCPWKITLSLRVMLCLQHLVYVSVSINSIVSIVSRILLSLYPGNMTFHFPFFHLFSSSYISFLIVEFAPMSIALWLKNFFAFHFP